MQQLWQRLSFVEYTQDPLAAAKKIAADSVLMTHVALHLYPELWCTEEEHRQKPRGMRTMLVMEHRVQIRFYGVNPKYTSIVFQGVEKFIKQRKKVLRAREKGFARLGKKVL